MSYGMGTRRQQTPAFWLDIDGKEGGMTFWNKDEKREERCDNISGFVFGVKEKERVYGKADDPGADRGMIVEIALRNPDNGERYYVSGSSNSRVMTRLLGQLNAADLSQPLYITPYLMKAGDTIKDAVGGTEKVMGQDTVTTSVKYVLGVDDQGNLELSAEGIRPFYGEDYPHGERLPSPVPVVVNGKPLMASGKPVVDRSELEALHATMVQAVQAKLSGNGQAQRQGHGDAGGEVSPEDAAAEIAALRQRGG